MLVNVHLFDMLSAILSGKVWDFFCLESGNRGNHECCVTVGCVTRPVGVPIQSVKGAGS